MHAQRSRRFASHVSWAFRHKDRAVNEDVADSNDGNCIAFNSMFELAVYVALLVLGVRFFRAHDLEGAASYVGILTAIFISIVVAKGEKPAGWRWGKR